MSYPIDGTGSLHIGTCPCNGCADRGGLEEAIELRASDLIEQGFSEDYAWTKAQDDLCPIEDPPWQNLAEQRAGDWE